MVFLLLLLSLALHSIFCNPEPNNPRARIVGGHDAPSGKYPYMASLRQDGVHVCGGSVISNRFILTAAHCVVLLAPNETNVALGSNFLNQTEDYHEVKRIITSNFDADKIINDIALLELKTIIRYNENIQPISLSTKENSTGGYSATLTGWGLMSEDDKDVPNTLQEIGLTIEEPKVCATEYKTPIMDSHICTHTELNKGGCRRDSGSPLVSNGLQIGILSYGKDCGVASPMVYTRVSFYKSWVDRILNASMIFN
ncbi:chymotrypsin-1-like [Prorops nasuta]|uniref:chymotrypsin-1-like n=1 Tax=Prorops nasuta TaxID=863751 RepID=UPI0034CE68AF